VLIFNICLTRYMGIKVCFISNGTIRIRITNNFLDNYSTRYRFLHIFYDCILNLKKCILQFLNKLKLKMWKSRLQVGKLHSELKVLSFYIAQVV